MRIQRNAPLVGFDHDKLGCFVVISFDILQLCVHINISHYPKKRLFITNTISLELKETSVVSCQAKLWFQVKREHFMLQNLVKFSINILPSCQQNKYIDVITKVKDNLLQEILFKNFTQ